MFSRRSSGFRALFGTQMMGTQGAGPVTRRDRGFTLIEVAIVVVIIAILAAMVLPRISDFREKAYIDLEMTDVHNFAVMNIEYFAVTGNYAGDVATLEGRGYNFSGDVVQDSIYANDQGFYFRVRHPGTTTKCEILFSHIDQTAPNFVTCTPVDSGVNNAPVAAWSVDYVDGGTVGDAASPLAGRMVAGSMDVEMAGDVGPFTRPPRLRFAKNRPLLFDASASYDPDGDAIKEFRWDFDGNGTVDAAGITVTHAFASDGLHNVKLTVIDDRGAPADDAEVLEVPGDASDPVAAMRFAPAMPLEGEAVQFDTASTTDPDLPSDALSFEWDFGDGSASTGPSVSHNYAAAGSYPVWMRATDSYGRFDEVVDTVTVLAGASLVADWDPCNSWGTSEFVDQVGGHTAAWSGTGWDFPSKWSLGPPPAMDVARSPVIRFSPSTFASTSNEWLWITTIQLGASENNGRLFHRDNGFEFYGPGTGGYVNPGLSIGGGSFISSAPVSGGSGTWHTFAVLSQQEGAQYRYTMFIDGVAQGSRLGSAAPFTAGTSFFGRVNNDYSVDGAAGRTQYFEGIADASFVASRHAELLSYACSLSDLNAPPIVDFTWDPASPIEGADATFTPTATDPDGDPLTLTWSWNDGSLPTVGGDTAVAHAFATGGSYTVRVIAEDALGKADTATHVVTVQDIPNLAAKWDPCESFGSTTFVETVGGANGTITFGTSVLDPYAAWQPATPAYITTNGGDVTTKTFIQVPSFNRAERSWTLFMTNTADDGRGGWLFSTENSAGSGGALNVLLSWSAMRIQMPALGYDWYNGNVATTGGPHQLTLRAEYLGGNQTRLTVFSNGAKVSETTVDNASFAPTLSGALTFLTSLDQAASTVPGKWGEVRYYDGAMPDAAVPLIASEMAGTSCTPQQLNRPPIIDSVTVAPQPLAKDQSATLTVFARDPDNHSMTYGWNFGDGASGIGNTTSHTYTTASTFTPQVVVTDELGGADTATVSVPVSDLGSLVADWDMCESVLTGFFVDTQSGLLGSLNTASGWNNETPTNITLTGGTWINLGSMSQTATDWTFLATVNASPTGYDRTILSTEGGELEIAHSSSGGVGYIKMARGVGVKTDVTTWNNVIPDNTWATVAVSVRDLHDGTSHVTLYVNGVEKTPTTGNALLSFNPRLAGSSRLFLREDGWWSSSFSGKAAGARYWEGVLHPSEIATASSELLALKCPWPVPPTASFTFSPDSADAGTNVSFDGSASSDEGGAIVSYSWAFGDGTTAGGVAPTHQYAGSGTYSATLTVTDNTGMRGSRTRDVHVFGAPVATFTYAPAAPTPGSAVSFNGSGSRSTAAGSLTYAWVFGDGNTGAGATPSHTYVSAGSYDVTLTITDALSRTASISRTVYVGTAPPVAYFTAAPGATQTNASFSFDGSTSKDPDGTIVGWNWDFGDGNSSGAPGATTHVYSAPASRSVTLTVTDNDGNTGSYTRDVVVLNGTGGGQGPVVSMSLDWSDSDGDGKPATGQDIIARGWANDPDGSIVYSQFEWSGGPTETLAGQTPTYSSVYAYETVGTYTVTFTAWDNDGNHASATETLTTALVVPPVAILSLTSAGDPENQTIPSGSWISPFWRSSYDPDGTIVAAWIERVVNGVRKPVSLVLGPEWNWGTAGISYRPDDGANLAILWVKDNSGLLDADTVAFAVAPNAGAPIAIASALPLSAALGASVTFSGASSWDVGSGSISSYAWDFGDGNQIGFTADNKQVSHSYSAEGIYHAVLRVKDNSNEVGADTVTVTVGSVANLAPVASFTYAPRNPMVMENTMFDASASYDPDGTITHYDWDFGIATDEGVHGYARFTGANVYNVTLTVTDNAGRTATQIQSVKVGNGDQSVAPVALFSYGPLTIRPGTAVNFDASDSYDRGGSITSYTWSFNNDGGAFASGVTTTRTFSTVGTYTVSLTVKDADALQSTLVRTVVVSKLATNQSPIARIGTDPTANFASNSQIRFSGAASTDPDGSLTKYHWEFGDGAAANGVEVTHTYASPGHYTAKLFVTDNDGTTGYAFRTLDLVGGTPPIAAFTVDPDPVEAGSPVSFNAEGSTDADGSVVSYSWDFGDFSVGSGISASHTFIAPGSYPVELRIKDDASIETTLIKTVTVLKPVQTLSVSPVTRLVRAGSGESQSVTYQATLLDADGNQMTSRSVVWSVTGEFSGTWSPTGPQTMTITFDGPTLTSDVTVTARVNGSPLSTPVTVQIRPSG